MSFKTACSLWAFWIFPAMFDNPIIYDQGAWKPTMFAANLLTFVSISNSAYLMRVSIKLLTNAVFIYFCVCVCVCGCFFFFLKIFFITLQLRDLPKNCLWWRSKVLTAFLLLEGKKWYWLAITFCKTPKSSLWRKHQVCLFNLDFHLPFFPCFRISAKWWKHKYGNDIFFCM